MRFAAVVVAALWLLPLPAAAEPCATLAKQVDAAGNAALVVSYPMTPDKALRNVAFLYDNAAAALALLGCGDLGHARQISDAILAAQTQDRFWKDVQLHNNKQTKPNKNPKQQNKKQDRNHKEKDGYQ